MKKWVVFIGSDQKEHICDLVRAYPYTKQLMLFLDGKEFFINFENQEDCIDAKTGWKKPVYISNKAKTKYRHGFAVFKFIIKK